MSRPAPRAVALRALGALLLAACPGCFKFVGAAALAPSTTPLEPGQYVSVGRPVRGEADGIIVFGVPVGDTSHTTREARADALAKAQGADALVNVSVSYNTTIYFGFVTVTNTWVWGEPVKLVAPPPEAPAPPRAPATEAPPPAPR